MYAANEGNLDGIQEVLDSGVDVNFRDIDDRTALHIASCQGLTDVAAFLLDKGATVDPKDRWGSTVILTMSLVLPSLWMELNLRCFHAKNGAALLEVAMQSYV
ncbi:unnamed protein product [Linum tenue]|uniref:Uncharacterized protein n=1 Tax=Linum tenue TaxID=586396 RepID=A0AAV0RSX7_9ROSI|nr:unnamed protein product [Linum tenue]